MHMAVKVQELIEFVLLQQFVHVLPFCTIAGEGICTTPLLVSPCRCTSL